MAPPATFLALQCCQCSTMQVKQKNKSSKWTCVVCNQKQSVRKVYAQGFMAKDVRKFVQSFNMKRQVAEQNQLLLNTNTDQFQVLEEEGFVDDIPSILKQQKRTDWAEYLDPPEEDTGSAITENDEFDAVKVFTEMPKPIFKKPKLMNPSISSTGRGKDCKESSHRTGGNDYNYALTLNNPNSEGEEDSIRAVDSSSSKWCKNIRKANLTEMPHAPASQMMQDIFVNKMGSSNEGVTLGGGSKSAKARASSKWSIYMSDDNQDLHFTARESAFHDDDASGSEVMIDQKVEEDIHPDFL